MLETCSWTTSEDGQARSKQNRTPPVGRALHVREAETMWSHATLRGSMQHPIVWSFSAATHSRHSSVYDGGRKHTLDNKRRIRPPPRGPPSRGSAIPINLDWGTLLALPNIFAARSSRLLSRAPCSPQKQETETNANRRERRTFLPSFQKWKEGTDRTPSLFISCDASFVLSPITCTSPDPGRQQRCTREIHVSQQMTFYRLPQKNSM